MPLTSVAIFVMGTRMHDGMSAFVTNVINFFTCWSVAVTASKQAVDASPVQILYRSENDWSRPVRAGFSEPFSVRSARAESDPELSGVGDDVAPTWAGLDFDPVLMNGSCTKLIELRTISTMANRAIAATKYRYLPEPPPLVRCQSGVRSGSALLYE